MAKNTTPELPVWIQDLSIEDIGRRGGSAMHVYVHGYWGDVITIYIRREIDWENYRAVGRTASTEAEISGKWTFEVSHSSGGRSTDEVPDSLEAEAYFAQGVLAAVQHARLLRSRTQELEKFYQNEAKAKAERDAARKAAEAEAKAARIKADKYLGIGPAHELVEKVLAEVKRSRDYTIHVYEMGAEDVTKRIVASAGRDGVVRFHSGGALIARTKLAPMLSDMSNRTYAAGN